MRVSIRRNVRVRKNAGTPIEDLGVVPDILYPISRKDLLEGNVDLIKKATKVLSELPQRQFDMTFEDHENLQQKYLWHYNIMHW